ncbi:insulin-like isoform X2 [Anoplopoma fimbria]|uniref:insulin-like isoform X2 n=1 Tax=Anoplopoma fimbria TaxID=229290 RepID=UPI0023EC4764|nr:insulin-like isoform X2 [Anoplopoma fimbria]XP_054453917.1 insulin-like isoform X2 [Anoplopoma fimbria]
MCSVPAVPAGPLLSSGVPGPRRAPVWLPPGGHPLLHMWRAGLFLQSKQTPQAGFGTSAWARQEQQLWKALSGRGEPKVKRGIVEQCCHKPCSIYHLEGYCD